MKYIQKVKDLVEKYVFVYYNYVYIIDKKIEVQRGSIVYFKICSFIDGKDDVFFIELYCFYKVFIRLFWFFNVFYYFS